MYILYSIRGCRRKAPLWARPSPPHRRLRPRAPSSAPSPALQMGKSRFRPKSRGWLHARTPALSTRICFSRAYARGFNTHFDTHMCLLSTSCTSWCTTIPQVSDTEARRDFILRKAKLEKPRSKREPQSKHGHTHTHTTSAWGSDVFLGGACMWK